jgi:hypothetical protein
MHPNVSAAKGLAGLTSRLVGSWISQSIRRRAECKPPHSEPEADYQQWGSGLLRKPSVATVHRIQPWATGGRTEPEGLALTRNIHRKLIEEGWTTRLNSDGNNYHHPERFLGEELTDDENAAGKDDDP